MIITNKDLDEVLTDEELKVIKSRIALKNNDKLEPTRTFKIVDSNENIHNVNLSLTNKSSIITKMINFILILVIISGIITLSIIFKYL